MPKRFTHGHALLIGVGGELPHTVHDAAALANLLCDPKRCAYPQTQVQLLTDQQATRANILDALDKLSATTAEATVIIYLGAADDATIDPATLRTKIDAIPAQRLLLLLDGYPLGDLGNFTAAGRATIASTQHTETLFLGGPFSVFAQALLEAFVGTQVAHKDGFVRIADLAHYVREQLSLWTLGEQVPAITFIESDNYTLAFYAAGEIEPIGLPEFLQPQALALESMPTPASAEPLEKTGMAGHKGVSFGDLLKSAAAEALKRIERSQRTFDQRESTVEGNQTNVAGDQHIGQQINNFIFQAGDGLSVPSAQPRAVDESTPTLISETIRLDVAKPEAIFVDETFDMAVAIRQPDSSPLAIADLTSVISEEGEIFRREENELVLYRVEVSAPDCDVEPPHLNFRLKAGENSRPRYFHITPRRQGRISLHVNAYQEGDELAAQTRVTLIAAIHAA